MKTKVLMLGPGAPGRETSGLGAAASHLAHHLSDKTLLTLVEPKQIEKLSTQKSIRKKNVSFTDFNILQEIATVSIESRLSAYQYQEVAHSKTMEKVESHQLNEQLKTFSEELVMAGEKIDFDVIYAHDWITFQAALDLKNKFKKPLLIHVHSLDFDRNFGQNNTWIFDLEKKALNEAQAVIAVSQYSKNIMVKHYGITEEKILVIPHGIQAGKTLKVKSPFKEKIILFVGRLSGQKGPTQFLNIAEKVNELYPDTRFVMAGAGDLYKKLIEAGASSSIATRFHITGYLDQTELRKLYAVADVYCMPSFSEPFGLTALEAADAGLPLVLSDHCGAAEWLPQSSQAHIGDTDEFAEKIVELLEQPALAKKQIAANKKNIKSLTWEGASDQILQIIQNIEI